MAAEVLIFRDLAYVFAPLKHARLDYMVQKAVEMGASSLQPVLTRFTQVARVNGERMRANVIEAAEQCGILSIATVGEPMALDRFLREREGQRLLVFCDEAADVTNPVKALQGDLTIPDVPSGTRFMAIASGLSHWLALTTNGTVVGWGGNSFGQCVTPWDGYLPRALILGWVA